MSKIAPIVSPLTRPVDSNVATAAAGAAKDPGKHKATLDPKVHKAAQEFEAMFVRQILTAAKVGGEKHNGYDGMAVDAVAEAVTQGGGLGLARQVEDAVLRAAGGGPKNSVP